MTAPAPPAHNSFTDEQLDGMVRDAQIVQRVLAKTGSPCTSPVADVCLHVQALASEVDRLKPFEQAMRSMAAQFVHPKTTAEDMCEQILATPQESR